MVIFAKQWVYNLFSGDFKCISLRLGPHLAKPSILSSLKSGDCEVETFSLQPSQEIFYSPACFTKCQCQPREGCSATVVTCHFSEKQMGQ